MVCSNNNSWSWISKGMVVMGTLLLGNVVLYNLYTIQEHVPFRSDFITLFGLGWNASRSYNSRPAVWGNVKVLSDELGISNASWMKKPIVTNFSFPFVHNPKTACVNKRVELLIAVSVSRSTFEGRQVIRETWGSYSRVPSHHTILLFFIGNGSKTEPPEVQTNINKESNLHGDIVQSHFLDTYKNLSLKSLSILRWIDAYCPKADFLTKADDDVYVQVPKLLELLRTTRRTAPRKTFILGYVHAGASPIRNKKSKWYLPAKSFGGRKYPDFTSGTSYSMTGTAARVLWQAALRTRFLPLEDVYITGICSRLANITLVNNTLQTIFKPDASGCNLEKYIIGGHKYNATEIRIIHSDISDKNLKCPNATVETKQQQQLQQKTQEAAKISIIQQE